jgi:hypothetical protein
MYVSLTMVARVVLCDDDDLTRVCKSSVAGAKLGGGQFVSPLWRGQSMAVSFVSPLWRGAGKAWQSFI